MMRVAVGTLFGRAYIPGTAVVTWGCPGYGGGSTLGTGTVPGCTVVMVINTVWH